MDDLLILTKQTIADSRTLLAEIDRLLARRRRARQAISGQATHFKVNIGKRLSIRIAHDKADEEVFNDPGQ